MARARKLAILIGAAAAGSAAAVAALPRGDLQTGLIQVAVATAPPGSVVTPPPGHYVGHLIVDRPVILDGRGQVTIDAGGSGSPLQVQADGTVIRGLRLVGSGEDNNSEDAGIKVHGNRVTIENNVIEDCLEGINLAQSNDDVVRGNHISSKADLSLGLKGDAIKLWYSNGNLIEGNVVDRSRDVVVWYSSHNTISHNSVHNGRYGLHFMYAGQNVVENNDFDRNSVGISMMYSEGVTIRHNRFARAVGSTGTCVAAKESSGLVVEDNDIVYCSQGIFLDVSPYQPGETNVIADNRISFNAVAVGFLSDWHDNTFHGNRFSGNFTDVAVYGGGTAAHNQWDGNFWDNYEGFDRDHDGVGDTPFQMMSYASRVWMETPATRFFVATPLLEVIDFLDRLAPFSQPQMMLEDKHPRYRQPDAVPDKADKTS